MATAYALPPRCSTCKAPAGHYTWCAAAPENAPPPAPAAGGAPSAQAAPLSAALLDVLSAPETIHALTRADLEHLEQSARAAAQAIPDDLQEKTFAAGLHELRRAIGRELNYRRERLAALQRLIDACDQDATDQEETAQAGPGAAQESETERAARLLRAGLIALMRGLDGPQEGGGGRPAPLVPPDAPRPTGQGRRF